MSDVAAYLQVAQQQSRNDIILSHLYLVKKIACHMKARLPDSLQLNDLMQSGMLGLIDASNHYLATKGASFETYAGTRIRGAILDDIRKNSWVPRSVSQHARQITAAIAAVEKITQRTATAQEIAAELQVSLDEYYSMLEQTSGTEVFSLDEQEQDVEDPKEQTNPFTMLEQGDLKQNLVKIIKQMPEKEQMILNLYYYEELNFKEIAGILDVSESRVCQLHGQAIHRIKAKLQKDL
jgi:RNA polymerase sigma factor for flagellar operon FliA